MNANASQLDRFLRRIHRRWVAVRTIERAGLCLLASCAAAVVLSVILIGRGESAMQLVAICLVLGTAIGLVIGWMTRPTLNAAAMEVDRQLGLADLLATALAVRRAHTMSVDSLDEQWAATILQLAEARCAQIEREPLMLRRFGARAWGGIGVSAAIVMTLGILSGNPLVLCAMDAGRQSALGGDDVSSRKPANTDASDRADLQSDPRQRDAESANASRINSRDSEAAKDRSAAAKDSRDSAGAARDQAGSGAGRTNEFAEHRSLDGAADSSASATGKPSSGGGIASAAGESGDGATGVASDHSRIDSAEPWRSDRWPEAQDRADDEIRSGKIPDAYRDLVRDYFTRQ